MIPFGKDGQIDDDGVLAQVLSATTAPSDIFVMSHGWMNSAVQADSSYRKMIDRMKSVGDGTPGLRPAGYRPLIVGIRWPSKAWINESNVGITESVVRAEDNGLPEIDPRLVAAIYENFPPEKASASQYRRDVDRIQELIVKVDPSKQERLEALNILRRYAIAGDSPDESNVFAKGSLEAVALPGLPEGVSILDGFRVFTYWQMKARAGVVGRNGVRPLLTQLQRAYPQARIHLFGHSFGAKVVLASVTERPLLRPVETVVLLQPAISSSAMADLVPGTGLPGGYRLAIDPSRVKGPIVTTFSKSDVPLNKFYPLASLVAGQVGEQSESILDSHKFFAMGAVGSERSSSQFLDMNPNGTPYSPFTKAIWSVDGGKNDTLFIGGHSDIFKDSVAWLLWSAIRASF